MHWQVLDAGATDPLRGHKHRHVQAEPDSDGFPQLGHQFNLDRARMG